MTYQLYLCIRMPYRAQYYEYLHEHFPDYNIISVNTEDPGTFPEIPLKNLSGNPLEDLSGNPLEDLPGHPSSDSGPVFSLLLCDSDRLLASASHTGIPRIAVSHKDNTGDDLMNAPWLTDSPSALTPDFLNEVCCRYYGLPLTILHAGDFILRELTSNDLNMLSVLQAENAGNPSGCFFPDKIFRSGNHAREGDAKASGSAASYLNDYISCQYPFYGYGFYAIEKCAGVKRETVGIAGFYGAEISSAETDHGDHDNREDYDAGAAEFPPAALQSDEFSSGAVQPDAVRPNCIEIGYALLKNYQGRGILSRILPALIQYGIETYEFDQISARIPKNNTRSLKAAQKYGLKIKLL